MVKVRRRGPERPAAPKRQAPINWGRAKDVQQFDAQLTQAYKQAVETFTRLWRQLSKEVGDRVRVTPWLLIRYAAFDLGTRPIGVNQMFWESPDIWVETEDPFGNPVAGKPNYIHARLFNLGALLCAPVKVDFYWGDPSVGLDAAHMHLIGSEYVEIPPLCSRDVRCNTPWVPVAENQGHECLIVNSNSWVADPIISPFQPVLDRHVGQRNVHVVQGSAGMMLTTLVQLANLISADAKIEILASLTHGAIEQDLVQRSAPREVLAKVLAFAGKREDGIAPVVRPYDAPFVEASLTGRSRFYYHAGAPMASIQSAGASAGRYGRSAAEFPGVALTRTTLRAGEQRALALKVGVPQAAKHNEFIVCRLYQAMGNQILGGYTLIILLS